MKKQNKKDCKWCKKASWWKLFQLLDECSHPKIIENHCGETGICFFFDEQCVCELYESKHKIS